MLQFRRRGTETGFRELLRSRDHSAGDHEIRSGLVV
jgi:hypothetical protein